MEWTSDQLMVEDQVFSSNKWLTISGSAGCGKTTIVTHITDNMDPGTFALLGPTHSSARNYVGGKTIHDFFNIHPINPESPVVSFKMKSAKIKTKKIKTIFIDECTMVKQKILNDVAGVCRDRDIRLIGIGDKFQLPSVDNDNKFNDFFNPKVFGQPTMSKIVRQSADNPVIQLSNLYKQYNNVPDISNTELAVPYKSNESAFIREFLDTHSNGDHNKIIAYSNNEVNVFNDMVHNELYDEPYCVGETIVLNENLYIPDQYGETDIYHNGLECIITASDKIRTKIIAADDGEFMVDSYELALKDEVGREILIKVIDRGSKRLLDNKRKEYEELCIMHQRNRSRLAESKLCDKFRDSKIRDFVSVSYGYATTIHKSQGKTYDNSFVFTGGALYYLGKSDIEMHNRALYTAFTRCRNINHTLQFKSRK